MLQTTVIAPSATDSDALSTVTFVLPPSATRTLIARVPAGRALIFGQPQSRPTCLALNWEGKPPCSTAQSSSPKDRHP